MKEELLYQMKEELNERKRSNMERDNKYKRLKELESNPLVIEYLNLLNEFKNKKNHKELSDDKIIDDIYIKYLRNIDVDDTNNIYVYLGKYKYLNDENDYIRVSDKTEDYDFKRYSNIELIDSFKIGKKICKDFEKNHIIIWPETNFRELEFDDIQCFFFRECIKNNQEIAKKKLLKKYGVNN